MGCQGVGKSTVLSLLAGWMPSDDATPPLRVAHKTLGIDVFVVPRLHVILLDTRPCLSIDTALRPAVSKGKGSQAEADTLRMALFLFSVCNVVLFVQGPTVDDAFMRWVRTALLLNELTTPDISKPIDTVPNLSLIHI